MLHFLPIIAVKGGRGGKGKLLACPQYKTMNTNTAYELSALAREGGRAEAAHCTFVSTAQHLQSAQSEHSAKLRGSQCWERTRQSHGAFGKPRIYSKHVTVFGN